MKRYLLLVCTLLMLSFSTAFASIPDSEFSLGGITVGVTSDYVKSIYGEPDKISAVQPGMFGYYYYTYFYGNSLIMSFYANSDTLSAIYVRGNNGFSTPAGITVGMDADIITEKYGQPSKIDQNVISYHEGNKWLVFVTQNGKIIEIKLF